MTNKLILFTSILVIIAIFGCEKSSDRDETGEVGIWQVYKVEAKTTSGGVSQVNVDTAATGTFVFKEDGSGEAHVDFHNASGIPHLYSHTFTYTRQGNQLELLINGGSAETWEIFEETASALGIFWTDMPTPTVETQLKFYMTK